MTIARETWRDRLTQLGARLAEKVCAFSASSLTGVEAVCFAMFGAWAVVLAVDIPYPISPALARLETVMPDPIVLVVVGAILGIHLHGLLHGSRPSRQAALSAGAVYWFTMTCALVWSGFVLLGSMTFVLFGASLMASLELIVRSDEA